MPSREFEAPDAPKPRNAALRPAPPRRLSPRAHEIWRETIGLVPDWQPLFANPLARYCSERADLERLDADFARMDPKEARRCRKLYEKLRRTTLRAISDAATRLRLSPASRAELN